MRTNLPQKRRAYSVLMSILLAGLGITGLGIIGLGITGLGTAARSEAPPSFMEPIAGRTSSTAASIANADVLALNTSMFQLYANAGAVFRQNLMAKHPIILGLFSGAGGRFILYRPGMAPLDAPSVPIAYQLLKSVGHSTLALAEIVMPYLDNASDTSWRASLIAYRSQMQSALNGLSATDMPAEWQENSRIILQNNIAFMDDCANKGVISVAALQEFANKQAPVLKKEIAWAAQTQVAHWMSVLADWKKQLGSAWDMTYAASNTIYVARQNNVLFSVLAQFFGRAMAAAGITYTLDQMDSDIISRLKTPQGPLVLLPYPVVTVDMGQNLARMKTPSEIETIWLDYVLELADEARSDPAREATTVVIGIHPFVIGTPDGAAALRRVLSRLKKDDKVWLTNTEALLKAVDVK
jgi:hypothetical protein